MRIETYKHNSIIGTKDCKLTLQDERAINVCLGKRYKKELLDKDIFYDVDVNDYAERCNLQKHQAYKDLREVATSLRKATVIIPQEKGKGIEVGWVHQIYYDDINHTLAIKWHELMIPFISGFKHGNYTVLHENITKLKSINTLWMYEILKSESYKGIYEVSLIELQERLNVSYKLFGDFRVKLLEVSVRDINLITDLQVTYSFKKTARKVDRIVFEIKKKPQFKVTLEEYK